MLAIVSVLRTIVGIMTTGIMNPPQKPDGYPQDLEQWIELARGRRVFIRPVVPSDAAALGRELVRADEATIYQRFFRAPVRLGPQQLERLTDVDYTTRIAIAAFAEDGEGAAIARFEPVEPGVVEVAVVVRPAWRREGLATRMLRILEEEAVRLGVHRLVAHYLNENAAIATVLDHLGFRRIEEQGGIATAVKDLGRHD